MTEQEQEIAGEEVAEQELEMLNQKLEALTREMDARNSALARLEESLDAKESENDTLKGAVSAAEDRAKALEEELSRTVDAYRALVVQSTPGIPAEMIQGSSVSEIDGALLSARALIERVRQGLEAEASRIRVPAGAPQRAPQDLSGLSAREKIQFAIGGN